MAIEIGRYGGKEHGKVVSMYVEDVMVFLGVFLGGQAVFISSGL